MANKPNRSPESVEQRREYSRKRSKRRYAEEREVVLAEIKTYKEGETYKNGADARREYNRQYQKKLRKARQKWFMDYKSTLSCEKCGFSHPATLEFHHLNSLEKREDVSYLVWNLYDMDIVFEEISKCIVLCANCHNILHYEESIG